MTNAFASWVSKITVFLLLGIAMGAFGSQFSGVQVEDSGGALLRFMGEDLKSPRTSVEENIITVRFPATQLTKELAPKVELTSPHMLISRAVFIQSQNDVVGKLTINGSREGLKGRIQTLNEDGEPRIRVQLPAGSSPTLALLQEEQQPIGTDGAPAAIRSQASSGWGATVVILILLGLGAGGSFYAYRTLSRRASRTGARKYLVESMSYCPLGPQGKAGVALVRVGDEFVLVGVTGNQVSMLSEVPRLSAQYRDDNKFESETFREAVAEEYARMRGGKEANA